MFSKLNARSVVSRLLIVAVAALVASLLTAKVGSAAILGLELHGSLGSTSTFDGNALGTVTQFKILGNFDDSTDAIGLDGQASYPFVTFSIELLNGPYVGTYTAPPDADLNVSIVDNVGYFPNISLIDGANNRVWQVWATFTPVQDAETLVQPFTYGSPYNGPVEFNMPGYTINLTGHTLVFNDLGATTSDFYGQVGEAFVAETVPEPSTYALGLIGLAGLGLVAWRRRGK
jgi:hypothetical protein